MDKGEKKLHKKINECLQFLEFHNSSTESWTDRIKKTSINQMRTFCRNELECLRRLIYCGQRKLDEDDRLDVSIDDKLYLG
jgi:hypothetical protein